MINTGFGSYVALMVMVLFGINDAPAYVVLTLGISVGLMSALILCVLSAMLEVSFLICESMHKLNNDDPHTRATELMSWYLYDQAKLSNLSKGND